MMKKIRPRRYAAWAGHQRRGRLARDAHVGLFLGSFNPVHRGHQAMAMAAQKQLALDCVWWLPTPGNPLKNTAELRPLTERMAGIMAWHKTLSAGQKRRHWVWPLEQQLGTRYTIDLLLNLRHAWPRVQFVLILGEDNWRQLPQWRDWSTIVHRMPIVVLPRHLYNESRMNGLTTRSLQQFHLTSAQFRCRLRCASLQAPAWTTLPASLIPLSSTQLRLQGRHG